MKGYNQVCILLITFGFLSCVNGQSEHWLSLAPLTEARQEVGSAELDRLIYVVGGFRQDRSTAATVEAYDPQTDTWRRLEPMPVAVNHPAAAAVAGKLYVIGGYRGPGLRNPTDALQEYNPEGGQWVLKSPIPSPRGGLAAAVIAGKIYVVGGARERAVEDVAAYDPRRDMWTTLAPLPTARDHLGVAVVGAELYAVGGRNSDSFTLDIVESYDPLADRWKALPPMPTGRSGHAVAALSSCLYAIGGEGNPQAPDGMFGEVEVFDTITEAWNSLEPMPTPVTAWEQSVSWSEFMSSAVRRSRVLALRERPRRFSHPLATPRNHVLTAAPPFLLPRVLMGSRKELGA